MTNVLLIGGLAEWAAPLKVLLTTEMGQVDIHLAPTGMEGIAAARDLQAECIILDSSLPDLDTVAALGRLTSSPDNGARAILLVTRPGQDALIAPALHAGARDHIELERLVSPVLVSRLQLATRWAAERGQIQNDRYHALDSFRLLVERSPFGVYLVDCDFRLVQVSEGAQNVFANVGPLIGRDFAEVLQTIWPEPFASDAIALFRHTLATGEPYRSPSTVEKRADIHETEAYDWKIERLVLPDGRPGVVCHFYDLSERQRHAEREQMLLREMNHRSKNMLNVVQAIARQTAFTSPQDFIERFTERVQALSASQDLLVKSGWQAVPFVDLALSQLAHFTDMIGKRILLDGPTLALTPAAAQSVGMTLHELATNAVKYGALANESGVVTITWHVADQHGRRRLCISWSESGGPAVTTPSRLGFGSKVIGSLIKMNLGADVHAQYAPTGFSWQLTCPVGNVLEVGEPVPLSQAAEPGQALMTAAKRVLVVEDEALIAVEITATLLQSGYEVLGPVGSVDEALVLLDQRVCDAAILDVALGHETAEPIARRLSRSGIPFVAVTGYSQDQLPAGFAGVPLISKPLHSRRLIEVVRGCFVDN